MSQQHWKVQEECSGLTQRGQVQNHSNKVNEEFNGWSNMTAITTEM